MNRLARLSVVWRAGLRPARWSFAAAVGVVAALSVPLVAAGTPPAAAPAAASVVMAQPTVSEGATNAQGDRLLAGADRYATAVLLASVPLDAGDAATREVLVVSGESLVDAVSAVSVAASRDAAIVLTATDAVPQVVADFIAGRGFDRVTVGGGTAAVSDTTADELAALIGDANARTPDGGSSGTTGGGSGGSAGDASGGGSGGNSVRRVAGATRFETAVAAARAAGQPGDWCDGRTAAVLVSGESLVDGVIAAPVAYAMGLPLLFTEPDALPEVVADYLQEARVERVVVVGGPDDVADTVTDALGVTGASAARDADRLNVAVTRFDAATPAARSVELAEATENCATQPVAPGQYALLDANQPVDGVAAAAALANGLGEHGTSETLIPILAVNQNSLPQPVADYLTKVGRRHDTITLYPLGGVARLTPRVVSRAVSATRGNPDTTDDANAGVDAPVLSVEEIAAAHGATVVIEDGFIKLVPPAGRSLSEVYNHAKEVPTPDDALPVLDEWLARPGVVDPYLWQPEIPVLEAGVDHDGDGELSADERYPLGSPERARYLIASGGDSPPGATVLAAPDMILRRFDEERDTSYRYPAGIPVPPGAPDRLTTTFAERDAMRAQRFEAYSGGKGFGRWDVHAGSVCGGLGNGGAPPGVPSSTNSAEGPSCETMLDWYLWMCDTRNAPEIAVLSAVDAWLATFDRFYEQWTSQMPAIWMFLDGLEDGVVTAYWADEVNVGQPLCTSNDDPANANSPENVAAHEARMAEITAWTAAPGTVIPHSHGPDGFTTANGRMLALRSVSESKWRRQVLNEGCYRDVRYCSDAGLSIGWDLRALA